MHTTLELDRVALEISAIKNSTLPVLALHSLLCVGCALSSPSLRCVLRVLSCSIILLQLLIHGHTASKDLHIPNTSVVAFKQR